MVNIPKCVHLEGTFFQIIATDCADIVEPAGHVSLSITHNKEMVNHSFSRQSALTRIAESTRTS